MSLRIVPIGLDEANAYVSLHHRHHKPVPGAKFCIGVVDAIVVGVAIVGRPVARGNDDSMTLELNRLATDGTKNACSALLGAVRRAGFALGYTRIITYTLNRRGRGEPALGRMEAHRRARRRLVELRDAATRGHAPVADQAPLGSVTHPKRIPIG